MSHAVTQLFSHLWEDYVTKTPSAKLIHQLLGSEDDIVNDHVAFRTLDVAAINMEKLAAHFVALGYEEKGQYFFDKKQLQAIHYEHPNDNLPKVFISELITHSFSAQLQMLAHRMAGSVSAEDLADSAILYSGTHWQVSYQEYQDLLAESEYAAWFAAFGFCANHFTVSVNHLAKFDSLEMVNQVLEDACFELNSVGGLIKGTPAQMLEQSSTMADRTMVTFSDQQVVVPSCFYEFARRYPNPQGIMYNGFIAASADKIFESTNAA